MVENIRTKADHFDRNTPRIRYPKFQREHLSIGSGVIEAGCKTVIGSRLKQSGMFAAPTPSSLSDAAISTAGLRPTGRRDGPRDSHFYVARPSYGSLPSNAIQGPSYSSKWV